MESRCISLVAIILFGGIVYGDMLDSASNLEKSGQIEEAIAIYGQWLKRNANTDSESVTVLIHSASLHDDPVEAISWLTLYVGDLPTIRRGDVFALAAEWEAALGLLNYAVDHLDLAIRFGGDDVDKWTLRKLVLLFSMGHDVRTQALKLKESTRNRMVAAEAGLLAVKSLSQSEGTEKAILELRQLIQSDTVLPAMWLELAVMESAAGNLAGQQEAMRRMEQDFPQSVYLYMGQSRIFNWESPSILMGSTSALPGPIQVGAFSRKDYASDLRKRLEGDGFTAWMEYADRFWRVVVNDPDGETAGKLKSMGY